MKKVISALICAVCFHAQASLVPMSDTFEFVRDADGTQLDWLNLTYNEGRLFSDILADTEVGGIYEGWRLATRSEFNGLLASAGYNANSDPNSDNYNITATVPSGFEAYTLAALINMLGDTWESYINRTSSLTLVNGDRNTMWSWGILADEVDTDNYYLGLLSQGQYQFSDASGAVYGATDSIPFYRNSEIQDLIHFDTQSAYLVRDIPIVTTPILAQRRLLPIAISPVQSPSLAMPVSEPNVLVLFGSCLLLLGGIRRKLAKQGIAV